MIMARVLVPLAEGCEELEAVTVIDLLRRAEIEVVTAGLTKGPVRASRNTVLVPDTVLEAVMDQPFDMIVLPPAGSPGPNGWSGTSEFTRSSNAIDPKTVSSPLSVPPPKVLAGAGLLDGRAATSYPGAVTQEEFPEVDPLQVPVVVDGKVITSRGPGTAMDFAL